MLYSFIILKILEYSYEYETYLFISFCERIKQKIKEIVKTEFFKWKYLIKKYPNHPHIREIIPSLKYINNIEIFNLLLQKIPEIPNQVYFNYNIFLKSKDIEIIKQAILLGAEYFDYCLSSDNIDIVKLGIENGANNFNKCLSSNNIDVVRLGFEKGAKDFNRCLSSNNIEVIKFGIEKGANDFENCLYSQNPEVFKLGIEKIDKKFESFLVPVYQEILKFGPDNENPIYCWFEINKIEKLRCIFDCKKNIYASSLLSSKNIEIILIGLKLTIQNKIGKMLKLT